MFFSIFFISIQRNKWQTRDGALFCFYRQEGNTINQYVTFCKVLKEQIEIHGRTETAVRETIRICCDRNILKEYLEKQEKEIVNIMTSLFNEEVALKNSYASVERRGIEIGERRGIEKGQQETLVASIKNIMDSFGVTIDKAMDSLKIPLDQRTMYAGLVENS